MIGRLAPGASLEAATSELHAMGVASHASRLRLQIVSGSGLSDRRISEHRERPCEAAPRTHASAMVDSLLHGADHRCQRTADDRPDFVPVIDDHHSLFDRDARSWLK